MEHGLRVGDTTRGKACHVDGCLGQHGGSSGWVNGRITWSEGWVVGQDDSHDRSHVWVDGLGWNYGLQVVKVLHILQILNGLHLDRLHAWQAVGSLNDAEVVTELGLVRGL